MKPLSLPEEPGAGSGFLAPIRGRCPGSRTRQSERKEPAGRQPTESPAQRTETGFAESADGGWTGSCAPARVWLHHSNQAPVAVPGARNVKRKIIISEAFVIPHSGHSVHHESGAMAGVPIFNVGSW